LKTEFSIAVAA